MPRLRRRSECERRRFRGQRCLRKDACAKTLVAKDACGQRCSVDKTLVAKMLAAKVNVAKMFWGGLRKSMNRDSWFRLRALLDYWRLRAHTRIHSRWPGVPPRPPCPETQSEPGARPGRDSAEGLRRAPWRSVSETAHFAGHETDRAGS